MMCIRRGLSGMVKGQRAEMLSNSPSSFIEPNTILSAMVAPAHLRGGSRPTCRRVSLAVGMSPTMVILTFQRAKSLLGKTARAVEWMPLSFTISFNSMMSIHPVGLTKLTLNSKDSPLAR